jgi:hypothetical protein
MFLFLASWLVLSVLGGILIGKAIHRADTTELRRPSHDRPAGEHPEPDAPATAPASPSVRAPRSHARVA